MISRSWSLYLKISFQFILASSWSEMKLKKLLILIESGTFSIHIVVMTGEVWIFSLLLWSLQHLQKLCCSVNQVITRCSWLRNWWHRRLTNIIENFRDPFGKPAPVHVDIDLRSESCSRVLFWDWLWTSVLSALNSNDTFVTVSVAIAELKSELSFFNESSDRVSVAAADTCEARSSWESVCACCTWVGMAFGNSSLAYFTIAFVVI